MNKTNDRILRNEIAYIIKTIDLNSTDQKKLDKLIEEQGIENVFAHLYNIFSLHVDTVQRRNRIMEIIKKQSY